MQSLSGIKHPAFQDALALLKPAGRTAAGRFLAEDRHLVDQALSDGTVVVHAVFSLIEEADHLAPTCSAREVPLFIATRGLMAKLLGTVYETSTTAVAIVSKAPASMERLLAPNAVVLCGERIQDPRNVGVMVRTADALGCTGVLLSSDSADPWQRAAVRSTTGSILRTPVLLVDDLAGTLAGCATAGATVVGSSGAAQRSASTMPPARPLVVVLGNEQAGISKAVAAACTAVVRIPMAPATRADSLNVTVAAGILLHEAFR
ncbi:MAG: TrmH family RNA methyltransferase [Armatimonadota bacterium]